jgi:hypothetical protein
MKVLSLTVAKYIKELCQQYDYQVSAEGVATALILISQQCGGSVFDVHKLIDNIDKTVSLSNKKISSYPPPRYVK